MVIAHEICRLGTLECSLLGVQLTRARINQSKAPNGVAALRLWPLQRCYKTIKSAVPTRFAKIGGRLPTRAAFPVTFTLHTPSALCARLRLSSTTTMRFSHIYLGNAQTR